MIRNTEPRLAWWEGWLAMLLAVAALAIPLLYPPLPPLVDLLGHVGRYAVMLDQGRSPELARYFAFHWSPSGNLGVDGLVWLLGPLIGLEPAVKLIVLAIPPLTALGFLLVAREVHGRIPPTAYFALPFALSHPVLYGFVNFALSMALAFLAFALWLRLGARGQTRLRALLFGPIALLVYFAHIFGWGVLGLLAASSELAANRQRGFGWRPALWRAGLAAAPLALPLAAILLWQSAGGSGPTADWFDFGRKLLWLVAALRDQWQLFDQLSLLAILFVLGAAAWSPRFSFAPVLLWPGVTLLVAFLVLPRVLLGSAYADMRLIPYAMAVLVLAIRPTAQGNARLSKNIALGAFVFLAIRVGATTLSLALASQRQEAQAAALDLVPRGARVAVFSGLPCNEAVWPMQRNLHMGSLVIARRGGFANNQWDLPTLNLRIVDRRAGSFGYDPSQGVRPNGCADGYHRTIDEALGGLPRAAFDYLWLIDPPPFDPRLTDGLTRVWTGPSSALYRVRPKASGQAQ